MSRDDSWTFDTDRWYEKFRAMYGPQPLPDRTEKGATLKDFDGSPRWQCADGRLIRLT